MFEKVNPKHPDKVADRIAGAIVDLAYKRNKTPKIAVEVLLGHGLCTVIIETDANIFIQDIKDIIYRITGYKEPIIKIVPQDIHLEENQKDKLRCGDNGIFKGVVISEEEKQLSNIARELYNTYDSDGKYILDDQKLIICQSKAGDELKEKFPTAIINPLGYWEGGTYVDSGATNRKLGSDMGRGITGGGLHGKDLSKGDVSINIYAYLKAQELNRDVEISCAIGDEFVDGIPYSVIVEKAEEYIRSVGGFEKFAEWGLI